MTAYSQFNSRSGRSPARDISLSPKCEFSRSVPARTLLFLILFACLGGGFATRAGADEPSHFQLRPAVLVDGGGVFADQLIQTEPPLTALRLCDAPAFGKVTVLTRAQVGALLAAAAPGLNVTNWTGAEAVRLARRTRLLNESEALELLTAALQEESVKDKGELELRFTRSWTAISVPDEALSLKVLDLPPTGVTPSFIVRFELRTERETVNSFQVAVRALVWREVWTARSTLKRGSYLADAEVARERKDVVNVREALADFTHGDDSLELAESVQAGALLLARHLKPKTVIRRGQAVLACVQDGALNVSLKVEALEDGAPGETIRVRNPMTRRDLSGRVVDEQTVMVPL